jgi:cell division protein FtsI/penicillin-binding protein 2
MKKTRSTDQAMLLTWTGIAFCLVFYLLLQAEAGAQSGASWQAAVDAAAKFAPDARIVVIDAQSGKLLAAHHLNEAARTLAEPGSTLKPLVLYQMVAAGRWGATARVACTKDLKIAGHRLNCTHPQSTPFNAEEALTWSCNTYFANLARTLQPGELEAMLRKSGLLGTTGLAADEATAVFRAPKTLEQTELAVLGVEAVRVSPLEMAEAYRWLARQLAANANSGAALIVGSGLSDSASFGMAGAASLGGVAVAGKTGTAAQEGNSQTHGWFAGFAPPNQAAQIVMVVYLPAGRGSDAARVAGGILKNSPLANNATKQAKP